MSLVPNDLTTGLDQNKVNRIKSLFTALRAEMTYLAKLDPEERSSINAVDKGRFQFVSIAEEVVDSFSDSLELTASARDKILRNNQDFRFMLEIEALASHLVEGISDTTMLLGAICYDEGLNVKSLVDVAVRRKKPGMEFFQKEMAKPFDRSKRKKDDENNDSVDDNNTDGKGGPAPLVP